MRVGGWTLKSVVCEIWWTGLWSKTIPKLYQWLYYTGIMKPSITVMVTLQALFSIKDHPHALNAGEFIWSYGSKIGADVLRSPVTSTNIQTSIFGRLQTSFNPKHCIIAHLNINITDVSNLCSVNIVIHIWIFLKKKFLFPWTFIRISLL